MIMLCVYTIDLLHCACAMLAINQYCAPPTYIIFKFPNTVQKKVQVETDEHGRVWQNDRGATVYTPVLI